MLTISSPAITLVIFSIQAEIRGVKSIDVETAFTSLAIIGLVTGPANTLLIMSAHMASAVASFERIQTYLSGSSREDKREIVQSKHSGGYGSPTNENDANYSDQIFNENSQSEADSTDAVAIIDANIPSSSKSNFFLQGLNLNVTRGSFTICCGPIGAGKTSLVKAILGDLPPSKGVIQIASDQIVYCSQNPWLPNGTIKEIIQGPADVSTSLDQSWYHRVVATCELREDFQQLPDGDQTLVGSRGIVLSGGQKQRVALARAIYAHEDLIILDDVLSALDAITQRRITRHLFGPKGLFKELGATVFLITHDSRHSFPQNSIQRMLALLTEPQPKY